MYRTAYEQCIRMVQQENTLRINLKFACNHFLKISLQFPMLLLPAFDFANFLLLQNRKQRVKQSTGVHWKLDCTIPFAFFLCENIVECLISYFRGNHARPNFGSFTTGYGSCCSTAGWLCNPQGIADAWLIFIVALFRIFPSV